MGVGSSRVSQRGGGPGFGSSPKLQKPNAARLIRLIRLTPTSSTPSRLHGLAVSHDQTRPPTPSQNSTGQYLQPGDQLNRPGLAGEVRGNRGASVLSRRLWSRLIGVESVSFVGEHEPPDAGGRDLAF